MKQLNIRAFAYESLSSQILVFVQLITAYRYLQILNLCTFQNMMITTTTTTTTITTTTTNNNNNNNNYNNKKRTQSVL